MSHLQYCCVWSMGVNPALSFCLLKTVLRTLRVLAVELLPPTLRNYCLQVCCTNNNNTLSCMSPAEYQHCTFFVCVCVTVKEQKGSPSSTGVNSQPRMMSQWQYRGPARRGCSAGFLGPTRWCGTPATSSAITWSKMTTCSTCWVRALTVEFKTCTLSAHMCTCSLNILASVVSAR